MPLGLQQLSRYSMFDEITSKENFLTAFNNTRKGQCKHKIEAIKFYDNWPSNLEVVRKDVINQTYTVSPYTEFKVFEPKERAIKAPKYRDKIVQHAINNVLRDFYEPRFIKDSYACIRGKGTHRALAALRDHASRACEYMDDPHFIKMDVSKFFYSIHHDTLKSVVRKKIQCQQTLRLLDIIIESSGAVGLPLGNLTSQVLANVYMNELDQYAKHTLKLKHYVRYADDFFAVVDGRNTAVAVKNKLKEFVVGSLKLRIADPKCGITRVRKGVVALGMKVHPSHIALISKHKRSAIKLARKGNATAINSWKSFASSANCHKFCKSIGI